MSAFDSAGRAMMEPTVYHLATDDLRTNRMTLEPLWVAPIPKEFALHNNYPNPFNPETWIPYQLAESGSTAIEIYDLSGRLVRRLDFGCKLPGLISVALELRIGTAKMPWVNR